MTNKFTDNLFSNEIISHHYFSCQRSIVFLLQQPQSSSSSNNNNNYNNNNDNNPAGEADQCDWKREKHNGWPFSSCPETFFLQGKGKVLLLFSQSCPTTTVRTQAQSDTTRTGAQPDTNWTQTHLDASRTHVGTRSAEAWRWFWSDQPSLNLQTSV